MTEINNFTEISENFDTVKTLLNSIRAQGILNTSDVDKILSGINDKLEKINTEEDIDIIKVFLTELKQTLDERHNVLVSKFGAIEALFSNLLKNSNELPKSNELKELFDVVATNLSVFSREVVSQKETLSDISLRLDAIRTDETQKKDIIKNITLLKPDLERLSNGFDTIVLSLNDNFKTIVKTISTIDKTEYLDKFSDSLNNIEMSSSALLSALQVLDKKTDDVDNSIQNLVTKSDLSETGKSLEELKLLNGALNDSVIEINNHYSRIDNLADKIDASVNIIAGLKSMLDDTDNKNTKILSDKLEELKAELVKITTDTKFEDFKVELSSTLKDISENALLNGTNIKSGNENIQNVLELINALDIKTNFTDIFSRLEDSKSELKDCLAEASQKIMTLDEANIERVLSDVTSKAEALNSKLNMTQDEISSLCKNNFGSVFENIEELKKVVSQIDDNGVSAYNAMFSNITDRLNMFEGMLKESLESQESKSYSALTQINEQVDSIKNLSGVLDYKIDSSVVEVSNMTRNFETLKTSVDSMLALDFVSTVKDLRADLYASKQEMMNCFESSNNEFSENFSNDLYGKYELLISKLETVEEDITNAQSSALNEMKDITNNISSSIVDILSYVSTQKVSDNEYIDNKLDNISTSLKNSALNYIETIKETIDVIKSQIEADIRNIEEENTKRIISLNNTLEEKSADLKSDINNSYSKLLEIQDSYNELKDLLSSNNNEYNDKIERLNNSANNINSEFETKLNLLKSALLDKITEFKQDFTCDNADKLNEFKFTIESFYNKYSQEFENSINNLKITVDSISEENNQSRHAALETIFSNFDELNTKLLNMSSEINIGRNEGLDRITNEISSIKEQVSSVETNNSNKRELALAEINKSFEDLYNLINEFQNGVENGRTSALESISDNFENIKNAIDKFVSDNTGARTSALAKILENIVSLKEFSEALNNKNEAHLDERMADVENILDSLRANILKVDENVDSDMTRQLSIIESNFESLISQMAILFEKSDKTLSDRINNEFSDISEKLTSGVTLKLENYKSKIEETFDILSDKAQAQSSYIQDKIFEMNNTLKDIWASQSESNIQQIQEISDKLKLILENHLQLEAVDYTSLKEKISDFAKGIEDYNENLVNSLKSQVDDITKYIDSVLDIQTQETAARYEEISESVKNSLSELSTKSDNIDNTVNEQLETVKGARVEISQLSDLVAGTNALLATVEDELNSGISKINVLTSENSGNAIKLINDVSEGILEQIELGKIAVKTSQDLVSELIKNELNVISNNIEKETDTIFNELIEQFNNLKQSQADESVKITTGIESIVSGQIYNSIEDLKSYLDVKTDTSVISEKLDNLKLEMTAYFSDTVKNLDKMLSADVFTSSLSDFRVANEIIVSSAADKLNASLENFIEKNSDNFMSALVAGLKGVEDKITLFDKKFVDAIVDKYEEIKLISNGCNSSLEKIEDSINKIFVDFAGIKKELNGKISLLTDAIKTAADSNNAEIKQLQQSFDNLRAQISNKSFDEAFQASINKQISNLESLIQEQFGYLEDINELCTLNLPDVTELNALVKNSVLTSIDKFSQEIEDLSKDVGNVETSITSEFKTVKSDIITQILNIFNQISFVTEQEEILDFIQEKHDELITVLSHIVTSSEDINSVKQGVISIDDKISSVKNEIVAINSKINSIISSDEDIDYIYSLQDLEADIANLRIVLQSMKEENGSSEISKLAQSTENIYNLIESVRKDMPDKKTIDDLAEDIVSISTRTNKLILASDESYKTLQDNLKDFKLVIDDLDERTKNFSKESGMDRIDLKLNTLNNMVQNGAKTNQVFNQVFEYLAEWVDNAGNQINAISNKVDSLDEIGQIKVMLEDLKAEAQDNSDSIELIEALGNVFDKQAKKISSLETKLDKIIVETTINNKNNKPDMSLMEKTLNKFLVAIGDKITSQQDKIEVLESKLEKVIDVLDEKDTAQLTKKVGGMDRQIAKLNKSIEKIASHVVEK